MDKNHIVIFAGGQWNSNFAPLKDFTFDANMMYTSSLRDTPSLGGKIKPRAKLAAIRTFCACVSG